MVELQCLNCSKTMVNSQNFLECPSCQQIYTFDEKGVVSAFPKVIGRLAKEEMVYHDEHREDDLEVHQLNSWRNLFYHSLVWKMLNSLPGGSRLLEIGAGSGFDVKKITTNLQVVATDISAKTLGEWAGKFPQVILSVACLGEKLPFADKSFEAVYMLATFHHFSDYEATLREFRRVLKSTGLIVIGIEPNKFYFRPLKYLRKILFKSCDTSDHSQADAEMEGFSKKELESMTRIGWGQVQILPVWFFAGFLHYFLEFCFRFFKLKKRIKLPFFLEKIIVFIDEICFKIPGFENLGWHWILIAQKED